MVGGIFAKLPIAKFPEIADPLITTPHQFSFGDVARAANLNYKFCDSLPDLQSALDFEASSSLLIEVALKTSDDLAMMTEIHSYSGKA